MDRVNQEVLISKDLPLMSDESLLREPTKELKIVKYIIRFDNELNKYRKYAVYDDET